MSKPDWNQLQAFLETAERGSLSAAARALGLTQPTLSRQVKALEASLGVMLFERVGKSLALTETGMELLESAKKMGHAADDLSLAATGRSNAPEGLVSISASDGIAAFILPPIIRKLRQEAPGIRIDVVTSNHLSDLRRREADIAIRHVRPEDPELIGKLIRDASASFYATKSWVQKHGHPKTAEDAIDADFIGFDRELRFLQYLQQLGLKVSERNFPVISENSITSWSLMRQGLGIGVMMDDIVGDDPDLVRILEDVPSVQFPIWLVTHRELKTARRIRVVYDILAEGLAKPSG
ncbi:MAG: LysR family transcriptional regulator [Pseudomonadota bacterium]